jgi:hypothetical protein
MHQQRIVDNRRANYLKLRNLLVDLPGSRALRHDLPDDCAPYVFPLWVDEPDHIYQLVRAEGVPVFRWDEMWPTTPTIENDLGIAWGSHVLQLGCHQDLDQDDISRMASILHKIFASQHNV